MRRFGHATAMPCHDQHAHVRWLKIELAIIREYGCRSWGERIEAGGVTERRMTFLYKTVVSDVKSLAYFDGSAHFG